MKKKLYGDGNFTAAEWNKRIRESVGQHLANMGDALGIKGSSPEVARRGALESLREFVADTPARAKQAQALARRIERVTKREAARLSREKKAAEKLAARYAAQAEKRRIAGEKIAARKAKEKAAYLKRLDAKYRRDLAKLERENARERKAKARLAKDTGYQARKNAAAREVARDIARADNSESARNIRLGFETIWGAHPLVRADKG